MNRRTFIRIGLATIITSFYPINSESKQVVIDTITYETTNMREKSKNLRYKLEIAKAKIIGTTIKQSIIPNSDNGINLESIIRKLIPFTGVLDSVQRLTVSPRFLAFHIGINLGENALRSYNEAIQLLEAQPYRKDEIITLLSNSQPVIESLPQYLDSVSSSPTLELSEQDLKEYKAVSFKSQSDPEYQRVKDELTKRIAEKVESEPAYKLLLYNIKVEKYKILSRHKRKLF